MNREANLLNSLLGRGVPAHTPDLPHLTDPQTRFLPQIDWYAYWQAFKEKHGEPLDIGGRCVFPDGWSYSKTDFSGPEWPPPTDPGELRALLRAYWTKRVEIVEDEVRFLSRHIALLGDSQRTRDCALQQRVTVRDEASGSSRVVTQELDLSVLEQRVAWLTTDLRESQAKLAELSEPRVEVQA